jgi:hypothetical protein
MKPIVASLVHNLCYCRSIKTLPRGGCVQIHFEQLPEYRCQDCRETCAIFILTRDGELRLCESCFEKLRALSQSAIAITAALTVRDIGLRVKNYLIRNGTGRLRLASRNR